MLVSCPECGTKISSEANPCPKCGFPEAGRRSLEYNQKCLEYYEKEAGLVKYPRPRKCNRCGYIGTNWTRKGYGLIKKETGYDFTTGNVYCPRCGESTDKGEWVEENTLSTSKPKPRGRVR